MSQGVSIDDDPDHPEGGHARVVFRGVALPASRATLLIETLTEGFDYRGPQRADSEASPVVGGIELRIGPEVVGALKQGLAVHLALEGTGKGFDVLWPELTPPRAAPRRSALSTSKPKRRVVADDGGVGAAPKASSQGSTPATSPAASAIDAPPQTIEAPAFVVPPSEETPVTPPKMLDLPTADAIASEGEAGKPREKRAGWSLPRVAAVGAVAFGVGAGTIGLMTFLKPAPVPTIEAKTDFDLPSPYTMLADLPSRSPDGVEVKTSESARFRERGEHASSTAEAQFWRRWAMRALLNSHTNNAAAVLDDFATTIATAPKADSNAAAARFIWELAALGNDCAAMDNIATALSLPGGPDASDAIATWQKRAESCRRHATSAR